MKRDVVAKQSFYVALGKMIRGFRIAEGVSLRDLAGRTGVTPRTITRIEEARMQCTAHMLVAIATELDLSLDFDLFPVAVAEVRKSA